MNLGCGTTPTPGWRNFDNSPTVRWSRYRRLWAIAARGEILPKESVAFAGRSAGVESADARRLPLETDSAEVVYSSHMLEHLTRDAARRVLAEALRVLEPGGILRLAVPDLALLVAEYVNEGDADRLIERTHLVETRSGGLTGWLRSLIIGWRGHRWMYDGPSLCRFVTDAGFDKAEVLPAGATGITNPGPLDLYERSDESVYVEAIKPL
jgi:SAM-dependent methyltransferase